MTPVEVLRKARELITGPGRWCRMSFHGGGSHCADGALRAVGALDVGAYRAARIALTTQIGISDNDAVALWRWNDEFARTQGEVLAAFDRAIALASEQPS